MRKVELVTQWSRSLQWSMNLLLPIGNTETQIQCCPVLQGEGGKERHSGTNWQTAVCQQQLHHRIHQETKDSPEVWLNTTSILSSTYEIMELMWIVPANVAWERNSSSTDQTDCDLVGSLGEGGCTC
jgi:hypothetical protein